MLIRILLLIILFVLLGRAIRGLLANTMGNVPEPGHTSRRGGHRGVHMVRDPVCGTFLPPASAVALTERDGRVLYFCSEACKSSYALKKK